MYFDSIHLSISTLHPQLSILIQLCIISSSSSFISSSKSPLPSFYFYSKFFLTECNLCCPTTLGNGACLRVWSWQPEITLFKKNGLSSSQKLSKANRSSTSGWVFCPSSSVFAGICLAWPCKNLVTITESVRATALLYPPPPNNVFLTLVITLTLIIFPSSFLWFLSLEGCELYIPFKVENFMWVLSLQHSYPSLHSNSSLVLLTPS